MKYVILVGDGMGDYPIAELGGKTPLEAAATPHLDELARRGELGCARTIPEGLEPGSDIANLAIMGYDPARYHTGRAPLEAAALGVKLGPSEVAFRCNLVTLRREADGLFMEDYSAGHIGSDEAKKLIQALEGALGADGRHFYPGVSYRHLLVWAQGDAAWRTYPPHDWTGQEVGHLMTDGTQAPLWELIRASWPVLQDHAINRSRAAAGQNPATSIWLWGQGRPPQLPTLKERFGLTGAVISAVDLIRGIGLYAGLTPILVVGATGFLDTNYAGKVAAALAALQRQDLVFIHVEAPDEAGHSGKLPLKLQAIEDFDAKVVGPLWAGLRQMGEDFRLLVLCDHYTPLAVRTHTPEPVPYVLYDSRAPADHSWSYSEAAARDTGVLLEQGADLLPRLLAN